MADIVNVTDWSEEQIKDKVKDWNDRNEVKLDKEPTKGTGDLMLIYGKILAVLIYFERGEGSVSVTRANDEVYSADTGTGVYKNDYVEMRAIKDEETCWLRGFVTVRCIRPS